MTPTWLTYPLNFSLMVSLVAISEHLGLVDETKVNSRHRRRIRKLRVEEATVNVQAVSGRQHIPLIQQRATAVFDHAKGLPTARSIHLLNYTVIKHSRIRHYSDTICLYRDIDIYSIY